MLPIRRALLSVADKTGLIEVARALHDAGAELLSTGGTAKALKDAGLPVTDVADYSGQEEILDGRVKTLHPRIHGGLLADRSNPAHMATLAQQGIGTIDMLISNLYPFEKQVEAGRDFDTCIENIDIGGPAMIRASAKNHGGVAVITDPADYALVQSDLKALGGIDKGRLRSFAAKAYARTAAYDAAISSWFAAVQGEPMPERLSLAGQRASTLRYGENPHQQAALYHAGEARPGAALAEKLQGKELSYNNLQDADSAFELVAEFEAPSIAIIKHNNPCGVASASSLAQAHAMALAGDPVSAFGGIVAANREIDEATAAAIAKVFTEVVIAPGFSEAARAVLAGKAGLRLLQTGSMPQVSQERSMIRSIAGGFLAQTADTGILALSDVKTASRRRPSETEMQDLMFAWKVCKHVRSNAIVLARGGQTLGIGAGQMSRVDSVDIAARRMATHGFAPPLVLASDAFFPFADGLIKGIEAGATAVIQPGGSKRDQEVIAAADAHDVAMVFTGMRHFRH